MHPLEQPLDFPERGVRLKRSSSIDNCFLQSSDNSSSCSSSTTTTMTSSSTTTNNILLALLPAHERQDFANKPLHHHERRLSLDGSGDLSKTTTFLAQVEHHSKKQPRDSLDTDRHAEQTKDDYDDDSSCSTSSLDSMEDAQWMMNDCEFDDDSDYEDSASFCDASIGAEGHDSYNMSREDLGASIQFMTDMDGFL